MATSRAPTTQSLVNEYPAWSSIRNDEQSSGAQLLNTIGLQLQDLHEQVKNIGSNNTIPFANVSDIDVIYKFFLPKTFEFDLLNNDQANPIYDTPTVVGEIDTVSYPITLASNNDIETFWYTATPTRISTEVFPVTNIVSDSATVPMYGVIASITQDDSPYIGNFEFDLPYTRLWVQTIGGERYIGIDDNGIVQRSSIVLTGINRLGIEESETLIFLHDDIIPTMNEWQSITRVEIYNITPSTVTVRLYAHRFERTQTPQLLPPKDFYNLAVSSESKQDMDTFYELGTNGDNKSILKIQTWASDDIRIRMSGFVGLDTMRSFELRNSENGALTSANDLAVEPFSNRIWVVDDSSLYLYDNELTTPNLSVMDKKLTGAMSVMQPSNYHTTPGDPISMEFFWQRQISDVMRHRVSVKVPDGTKYNVVAGSFNAYDPTEWIFNSSGDRFLRAKETYTLLDPGDYVFTMEVLYRNGTTEIDQRIISVDTKLPLFNMSLSAITSGGTLLGVDFDSDHNLWILVDHGEDGIDKLKVTLFYDVMMIDYQNKVIFFKDTYDQVRVS